MLHILSPMDVVFAYRLLASFPTYLAQRVMVLCDMEGQEKVGREILDTVDASVDVVFLVMNLEVSDRGEGERIVRREVAEDI